MATRSAGKAHRQSLKRHERNRSLKSATRTRVRLARAALGQPKPEEAVMKQAISALDRAASKGVYHPNKTARQKSRLMKRLSRVTAGK